MTTLFTVQELAAFSKSVFHALGFTQANASISANCLIRADLRGIDSHGIARLPGYVRLIRSGRINPKPEMKFSSGFAAVASMDADMAIGFLSGTYAMNKCIEMAEEFGCGMVAVQNSNHFGIAGQYALMAAEKGYAGFAFTNASPLVAPTNSLDRLLGTNPIAAAFPSYKSKPFVLDMATTTAANGKLEILQRNRENTPHGWVQDSNGDPSIDANELKNGGALLPLGGTESGGNHKGYGLGALVDILSGVCSGANFGPWVPPFVSFLPVASNMVGKGIGHFFMAFRTDAFLPDGAFLERMEAWMNAMRSSRGRDGRSVLVPGDPEWKEEEIRQKAGIPIHPEVLSELRKLSSELEIILPQSL